jgi:hypothetical protein
MIDPAANLAEKKYFDNAFMNTNPGSSVAFSKPDLLGSQDILELTSKRNHHHHK